MSYAEKHVTTWSFAWPCPNCSPDHDQVFLVTEVENAKHVIGRCPHCTRTFEIDDQHREKRI